MCAAEQRVRRLCSASGRSGRPFAATPSSVDTLGQLVVRFPDGSEKRLADTTPEEIVGRLRDAMDGDFFFFFGL
jgi:hypothetical protein